MTNQDTQRLIEIIREKSFSTGTAVTLASGRSSSFYFNMKPAMLDPEGATLIARLILAQLKGSGVELAGGLEMGAVPLAASLATLSHMEGEPIRAFFMRKQAKAHGTKSLVEGLLPGETLTGKKLAILEDVTTTGGSALQTIKAVQAEGAQIVKVITVVDRQEGAADTFAAHNLPFSPLLRAEAFRT